MLKYTLPLLLLGCTGQPSPPTARPEATPPAAEKPATAASDDAKPKEAKKEKKEPTIRPATPPPPGPGPHAILQGYGIEVELYPPFQAARIGKWMNREHEDTLMWSWWDTSAPGAGQNGYVGLYNLVIVPGKAQPPGTALQTITAEEQGKPVTAYRFGDDGTEVRLAPGVSSLEGIGVLRQGPDQAKWTWKAGEQSKDWPDRQFVHSADPAKGEPLDMDGNPHRPWGPWPTAEPVNTPSAPTDPPAAPGADGHP